MAAASRLPKSPPPNQWGCSGCVNGLLCWAANSKSKRCPMPRAPRSPFPFRCAIPTETRSSIMKILLADDHTVVRRGMKQILADEFKRAEFGEARNAQEALDLVWK